MRKRMLDSGKFDQDLLECAGSEAEVLRAAKETASPVLMEVLQASARVSVPDAAKQRVWELCATPPALASLRCRPNGRGAMGTPRQSLCLRMHAPCMSKLFVHDR